VTQLVVGTLASGLPQFDGKGFGARVVVYPILMLLMPVAWLAGYRLLGRPRPVPWDACALVMLPFLIDVTGNTLDLYDSVWWWDDANHFVNWFFLNLGVGLLLAGAARQPGWALLLMVSGIGAIMAIGWEIGEYFAFIRGGTEL